MSEILYIQASPRSGRSKSITVADAFLKAYKKKNPSAGITSIDLFKEDLPSFDGLAVQAKYTILHGKEHSKDETQAWTKIEKVISQFTSADKYVLAVPMWNFSIPYRLKQYLDILVQPGYTFSFDEKTGYSGLIKGKPLLAVYARGGEYPPQSEAEAFDMQKKYIEQIFGFMGFQNIKTITIEPTIKDGPQVARTNLNQAIEKAQQMANDF